ncbi:hypothetical protein [Desulforamulus aeronauticus]|uniref:Uncharacterized protein n=1 Tax=Desulforamulus aeronauticus DSM 10349 TaxID=1121421 RepID=A0A1M6UYH5_9FIRM|nr:hypothetical protein [Desulforamulus aeronauticus]SHK74319.1 hypothetical protein SAMN02745123_02988 [Desulforamulus aeronauticus DSM 10349]
MRILKLLDKYYCIANESFAYEELEKRISDVLHLQRGSFAEFYSKRIFRAFFQYARDLKKEYLTYYPQEYESFEDYLYKKELLDWEHMEILDLGEGQTLLKLNINLTSYNADNLIQYEENGIDVLNQALKEIGL